jgi:hypothetical protein
MYKNWFLCFIKRNRTKIVKIFENTIPCLFKIQKRLSRRVRRQKKEATFY